MLAEPLWRMVSGSLRTSELPREEDFQRLAAFCEKPQGVRQEWLSSPLPPPWGNAAPVSGLRSLRILCPAPWVWARAQLLCPPAPASRAASLGLGFLLGVSGEHSGSLCFLSQTRQQGPRSQGHLLAHVLVGVLTGGAEGGRGRLCSVLWVVGSCRGLEEQDSGMLGLGLNAMTQSRAA